MTDTIAPAGNPSSNRATLIVSPFASRVRDAEVRSRIVKRTIAALHARGLGEVVVLEAGTPQAVRAAAAQAVASGSSLVTLIGGDGTVRDASGVLAGTGVDAGIIPAGTGNLFASSIGVPRDTGQAIANLTSGSRRSFDMGRVRVSSGQAQANGQGQAAVAGQRDEPEPFMVACGTGFDARLIGATTREMKRRYGVAAYFLSAARLTEHLSPRPTILTVDDVRSEIEAVVVLIANCGEAIPGRLGPRLPIDPQDGLLHVFILPRGGVVGGIRGAMELMMAETYGRSASGSAIRLSGRHVQVEVSPAQPTEVDGDSYQEGSLEAWIRPGALSVIVP